MTTTNPPAALVPVAPVFSNTERLALAGFLAGYRGPTRQAYELDLRQYVSWTVPAAVSTGTPPISSPPTLPEPPGKQLTAPRRLRLDKPPRPGGAKAAKAAGIPARHGT